MATIKGENLRVMLGDNAESLACIAASTACTVHASLQVEEDTTKDTQDAWITQTPVGLAWDVQVEALIIDDSDTDYRTGAKNIDQLHVGRTYTLRFAQTAGAAGQKNRDAIQNALQLTGKAILSDLNITSQNDETATATCQFTGYGQLTPYTPS